LNQGNCLPTITGSFVFTACMHIHVQFLALKIFQQELASQNLNHDITPRITLTTISLMRSEDIIIYDEREKTNITKTQEQKES